MRLSSGGVDQVNDNRRSTRPDLKFHGKNRVKQFRLVLTRQPGFDESVSDAEVREVIRAKVREKEAEVLERHHREGKPFVVSPLQTAPPEPLAFRSHPGPPILGAAS